MQAMLLPAYLIFIGFDALAIYNNMSGFCDRHIWDVNPEKYATVALV
jgi:hypothetical protein